MHNLLGSRNAQPTRRLECPPTKLEHPESSFGVSFRQSLGGSRNLLGGFREEILALDPFSKDPLHNLLVSRFVLSILLARLLDLTSCYYSRNLVSPSTGALFRIRRINGEGGIPFSTKLAAGLRSAARNYKATRLLTRPG
jgi:hypothetical protein